MRLPRRRKRALSKKRRRLAFPFGDSFVVTSDARVFELSDQIEALDDGLVRPTPGATAAQWKSYGAGLKLYFGRHDVRTLITQLETRLAELAARPDGEMEVLTAQRRGRRK